MVLASSTNIQIGENRKGLAVWHSTLKKDVDIDEIRVQESFCRLKGKEYNT